MPAQRTVVVTVAHPPEDARIRHRQLRALQGRGHAVTYLAPFTAFGAAPPPGVDAVDVPRSRGLRRLGPVWAAARHLHRLAPGADIVIGHDPELLPALLWLRLRHRHLAVVWDVHEDVPAQVHEVPSVPRWVRRPLAAAIHAVELVVERALHLTLAERSYQRRFTHPHPVVPNSTWVPAQRPRADVEDRVVYVGAITRQRGVDDLLAVAELLAPQVRLELIGNAAPALDAELRARTAGTTVDYRGFVPNDRALQRLPGALAGLSLLPDLANHAHSQLTKVQEYMAHGLPVVTTANPASRDLVEGSGCGFVVGFGDAGAAADAVRRLREEPALREAMGARGHAAARRDHDWGVDGDRFVDQVEAWARRG